MLFARLIVTRPLFAEPCTAAVSVKPGQRAAVGIVDSGKALAEASRERLVVHWATAAQQQRQIVGVVLTAQGMIQADVPEVTATPADGLVQRKLWHALQDVVGLAGLVTPFEINLVERPDCELCHARALRVVPLRRR